MYKVAVLISGGGTNLQALLDAQADGKFANGRIVLVVADRYNAGGLQRAAVAGVETAVIPRKHTQKVSTLRPVNQQKIESPELPLLPLLQTRHIDFVVLSGYLSILPPELVATYRNRIINIHPALMPSFCGKGYYGLKVHEAVLTGGVKITGVTVHFVDEGVDTGMIIAQRPVPVLPTDTAESLRDRVLETEHVLLVEVVQALTDERICIEKGKAWIY